MSKRNRHRLPTLCVWMICGALVSWAPRVNAMADLAPSAASREEARRLFDQAELHFAQGHYRAALRDYDRAHRLTSLPGFLLNMADCETRLGNAREAARLLRAYLELPEAQAPHREAAAHALAQLEPAKVEVKLEEAEEPQLEDEEGLRGSVLNTQPPDWRGPILPHTTAAPGPTEPARTSAPSLDLIGNAAAPEEAHDEAGQAPSRKRWLWASVAAGALVTAGSVFVLLLAGGDGPVEEGSLGSLSR